MKPTAKKIKSRIDGFFSSTGWKEIINRLNGQNPIVFIIVKQQGGISHVIVKSGETYQDLGPEKLEGITSPDVEPEIRHNIDRVIKGDIVATHPEPRIIGLEEKESLPLPQNTPTPAPGLPTRPEPETLPMTNGHVEEPIDLPQKIKPPKIDTVPVNQPNDDGEIDLQIGMKIVFMKDGSEQEGQITALFEDENQLLVSLAGTKKKDIIDAEAIRRVAK